MNQENDKNSYQSLSMKWTPFKALLLILLLFTIGLASRPMVVSHAGGGLQAYLPMVALPGQRPGNSRLADDVCRRRKGGIA